MSSCEKSSKVVVVIGSRRLQNTELQDLQLGVVMYAQRTELNWVY